MVKRSRSISSNDKIGTSIESDKEKKTDTFKNKTKINRARIRYENNFQGAH